MAKCSLKGLLPALVVVLIAAVWAVPAAAQYRPLPMSGSAVAGQKAKDPRVEISVNLWSPEPAFVASSDGLGISGTTIDAQADLGITKKSIFDFRAVLKAAKRHKFRFAYLPMRYTSTATLNAAITFNGVTYPVNAEVASDLRWKTYRAGYEFDILSGKNGFLGIILEAKVTQTQIQLNSVVGDELAKAAAPIPAIGAIARVNVAPGFSVTAEYTYFKLPKDLIKDAEAHYKEYDISAMYILSKSLGAQAGYRKIDVGVTVSEVFGSAVLSGPYFGAVLRF